MKESNPDFIKKVLKPHRAQIDKIDAQLIKLLGKRFGVVKKVADVKIKHNIPAFLGDRVEQVKRQAAEQGAQYGIDEEFIRTLYTLIIYQSCALEDAMKGHAAKKKKKA
ncbi:MAG: chorismate mutase [Alphaproteobacteria bacterium]|jgi:chorismate mutase-like protein